MLNSSANFESYNFVDQIPKKEDYTWVWMMLLIFCSSGSEIAVCMAAGSICWVEAEVWCPATDTQWRKDHGVQRGMYVPTMAFDTLGVFHMLLQHRWCLRMGWGRMSLLAACECQWGTCGFGDLLLYTCSVDMGGLGGYGTWRACVCLHACVWMGSTDFIAYLRRWCFMWHI